MTHPVLGRQRPPRLKAGVVTRSFGAATIVAAPDGRTHLQLDRDQGTWLSALDGRASAEDLEERFGSGAADLLDDLHRGGFLLTSPPRLHRRVVVTAQGIELDVADAPVRLLHRLLKPMISCPGAVCALVVSLIGLLAWCIGPVPDPTASGALSPAVAVVVAVGLRCVIGVVHELGHAVVVAHHGRRVGRVGVGLHWGLISCYVDATDALLLDRRQRVQQAAAGPAVDGALGGLCAIAAVLLAPHPLAQVLSVAAGLCYLGVLLNLTPLLHLDGYWLLADLLDTPDLGADARKAWRRGRTSARSTRERLLAVYAVVGVVAGAAILAFAVWSWWTLFGDLAVALVTGSWWYRLLGVVLVAPLLLIALHLVRAAAARVYRTVISHDPH